MIEAVFEELQVKKTIFAELEKIARTDAILATNTSSLSVTEMAADLEHPERVVGFHFFNPVAVLPLLEIVRGDQTDDASLATAFAVGKKLKKSAVLVKDAPAFVVNRILTRFMGEIRTSSTRARRSRTRTRRCPPSACRCRRSCCWSWSARRSVCTSPRHERRVPDRFAVSENLAGRRGGKASVYVYGRQAGGGPRGRRAPDAGRRPSRPRSCAPGADRVAQEIGIMLDEGVVAEAQDIDLCLIPGAGWPFHLGGITPYLDRTGISEKINGPRFLPKGCQPGPAQGPLGGGTEREPARPPAAFRLADAFPDSRGERAPGNQFGRARMSRGGPARAIRPVGGGLSHGDDPGEHPHPGPRVRW